MQLFQGSVKIAANLGVLGGINSGTVTGSSNAYIFTSSVPFASYAAGVIITGIANHSNTGAATINVDGLGAKSIVKCAGGVTTSLAGNDMLSGQAFALMYDGTNMQLLTLLGN